MCLLDAEEEIKKILEAEGVGCATAYNVTKKVMKIVDGVASDAYFKGQKDMEEEWK